MEIRENMNVIDANGEHVGIVEAVEANRIKLRGDEDAGSQQRFIDKGQVAAVEENQVKLKHRVSSVTTQTFVSRE